MSNTPYPSAATAALIGALLLPLHGTAHAADLSIGPSAAESDQALTNAVANVLSDNTSNPLVPWTSLQDNSDGQPFFWVGSGSRGAEVSTTAASQQVTYRFLGSVASWGITFSVGSDTFTHAAAGASGGFDPDLEAQPDITDSRPTAGLLEFTFTLSGDNGCFASGTAGNGSNRRPGININIDGRVNTCRHASPNFIAAYVRPAGDGIWEIVDSPTEHVLMLLDDGSKALEKRPDADYNDMMILISASDEGA